MYLLIVCPETVGAGHRNTKTSEYRSFQLPIPDIVRLGLERTRVCRLLVHSWDSRGLGHPSLWYLYLGTRYAEMTRTGEARKGQAPMAIGRGL